MTQRAAPPLLAALITTMGIAVGCREPAPPPPPHTTPEAAEPRQIDEPDPRLRRLTHLELENSLRFVLGPVEIEGLEPDFHRAGLARVGATEVTTSTSGVERFSLVIETALDAVFANTDHRDAFIGCRSGQSACASGFIARVGQRAWRRPLRTDEVERYGALQSRCLDLTADFNESLRCVASALLHSPYFLYRVELPTDGVYKGYDMASRLSYFLWSAPPDTALLQAAVTGGLDSPEGLRAQARRMLETPRARQGMSAFVDEWYRLDQLDRLERDILAYTNEELQFRLGREGKLQPFLAWMAFAAKEELRRMVVGHVFDDDADYLDLLITDRTYVDPHLAAFYELGEDEAQIGSGERARRPQLALDDNPDALGFVRAHHTDDSPRRGVMGTMALLSQLGKQNETSPTRRGLYMMERILCLEIGDPPDNIDMCPRPEEVSRRNSMEAHHMCAASCTGCHSQMDPLGFALDGFDTIGRARSSDDWGYDLDTDVTWSFSGESGRRELAFNDLRSMSDTFYNLPEATSCVTRQIYRFATGQEEGAQDEETIAALTEAFAHDGRRMKAFLIHFVGTDAFRKATYEDDTNTPATLETISTEIFGVRCAPCHVGDTLGGLDLAFDGQLRTRLLSPSLGQSDLPLIAPGEPERSYLWHKVAGTHVDVGGSGDTMPPNNAMTEDERSRLKAWIEGGSR